MVPGRLFTTGVSSNPNNLSVLSGAGDGCHLNSSFDQTMKQWQTKLNSLSNILNKNSGPPMKSKHLYKYLNFEHGLFQIFRISENALKRSKLIAFEKLQRGQSRRIVFKKTIKNLINIKRGFQRSLIQRYLRKWENYIRFFNQVHLIIRASEVALERKERRDAS
jgi:hypothetical protein